MKEVIVCIFESLTARDTQYMTVEKSALNVGVSINLARVTSGLLVLRANSKAHPRLANVCEEYDCEVVSNKVPL